MQISYLYNNKLEYSKALILALVLINTQGNKYDFTITNSHTGAFAEKGANIYILFSNFPS